LRRLFLLVAALILYGSLFPWVFHPLSPYLNIGQQIRASWPREVDRWLFKDALLNVAIYIPLGVCGGLAFSRSRRQSWAVPILSGIALSAAVEYLQLYTYTRVASAFDLLTNVIGTVLGTIIAHRVRIEWRQRPRLRSRPDELLVLVLFGFWQLYPFFPVHGRTALRANLAGLSHFDSLTFLTVFAGWLSAGVAARTLLPGRRIWWLAVILPIKPLIINHTLSGAEVAGAVLTLVILSVKVPQMKIVAVIAAAVVFLREILPLSFSSTAVPFNWIPLQGTLGSYEWLAASGILVTKLFLTTVVIWLFWRSGVSLTVATGTMAVALFALELLQTHLPGRTPESTDALLALAGGLALRFVDRRRARGA